VNTDPGLHRALGLTDDELAKIEEILGRSPNELELAMYAVMWSEHCSYKSSRLHLRRLPTEAPHVIVGPGENAGVIDVGDGIAVALRIESHNHPSAVEPYQGAATGVGGILRDIFTMGARPIALADALYFGDPASARVRYVAEGVVSGISGYGNSVGVPTVAGETTFDPCYTANPLVNVMCVGVLPKDRLVLGRASGAGNLAILLGSSTGRDGIGGVSVLASAPLPGEGEGEPASKRPSVQIGDPFEEKRLIEACLELLDAGVVVGIQDLGGAGLTCATSETAARASMGMDVYVGAVPRREASMEPFEVMTSESQERMLAIVEPSSVERVMAICSKWEVGAAVVGRVTDSAKLRVIESDCPDLPGGESSDISNDSSPRSVVLAEVPAKSLSEDAPLYDRPIAPPSWTTAAEADAASRVGAPADCGKELIALLSDPSVGCDSWVYGQYDHQLFLNTVVGPGGDATVLKLKAPGLPPSRKGLAISVDGNPRWCAIDPRGGTAMVVAEAALNVACAGAVPKALVNCLNFGNPEHPQVMWQLSEAIDGMAQACRALKIPVVGGNASLYNESEGIDIKPTPVVGVVGLIDNLQSRPPTPALADGSALLLLGPRALVAADLGGSRWMERALGFPAGPLPQVNFATHAALLDTLISLVRQRLVTAVHDVSDGGLAVAIAEMAIQGNVGVTLSGLAGHEELFAETPSRVLVATSPEHVASVERFAKESGLTVTLLGSVGGNRIQVAGLLDIAVSDASAAWKGALASALTSTTVLGAHSGAAEAKPYH
jgi:phosphoribosylformylglycinamidine synthase II